MAQSEEHVTQMTRNDLHDKGACILRHPQPPQKFDPCDHMWNGYTISLTATRKAMYNREVHANSTDRTRAYKDIKEAAGKKKKRSDETHEDFQARLSEFIKKYRRGVRKAIQPLPENPKAWFIGPESSNPLNFVPKRYGGSGWKTPYYHNWHHIVPNGAVHEFIGSGPDGTRRLFLLMTSLYNINCGENIVLLPKQSFVGRALSLPIHCPYGQRSHKKYSKSCESDLTKIAKKLQKVLDAGKPHKLNDQRVTVIKADMLNLSRKLLGNIKTMPAGESLNRDVP
ncbi:AHH domain-containing protein [Archangium sp.]|uniref:AHH domain-containing protein n=1 Tax=Archangium sp. TaxID=1872627 RepID=UPI002D6B97AD|nr:AHH domain-containing protein [Archangium sp.]HYO55690.1 AHH domain-containing protein [Archangium sp.]